MGLNIGIDVDIPVVDTPTVWRTWMISVCSQNPDIPLKNSAYNISTYFQAPEDVDLMEFWRSCTLYDNLSPRRDAVNAIKDLHDAGNRIIFVSSIKGNHHKSKYNFLKKHFPFMAGFIATKEKHYVDVDVMIDDRTSHLNAFYTEGRNDVLTIRYESPYRQYEKDNESTIVLDNWKDIYYEVLEW